MVFVDFILLNGESGRLFAKAGESASQAPQAYPSFSHSFHD
jgi:hypothetical protein